MSKNEDKSLEELFEDGWRYFEGNGVDQSNEEAFKLWKTAAEQEHRIAKECVERLQKIEGME